MATQNSGGRTFVPLLAALVALCAGYGLGRVQGNATIQAQQEKLEDAERNLKVAQEATTAVEKKSARLLALRYIESARKQAKAGDEAGARVSVNTATRWLQEGASDRTRSLLDKLNEVSQAQQVTAADTKLQEVTDVLDKELTLAPTREGTGVSQ